MHTPTTTRLLTWVLVVSILFWFGSCSKSGSDPVNPGSSIEGTWAFSGLKIDPAFDLLGNGTKTNDVLPLLVKYGGADVETCFKTTRITFLSGGKITGVAGQKCTSTTSTDLVDTNSSWKLDGNKLTLTDSSGASEVYDTAISGNTLKISQTSSDADVDGDGKNDTVTQTIELTRA